MPRPTSPRIDAAERDAKALELRKDGLTYTQIAERLGISRSTAHKHVTRGLHRTRQEPADELRRLEAERLNQLWAEAMAVLRRRHVLVQSGKVVKGDDGQPIPDDGPVLQATTTLLRIMERRARLLGLDAPARHEVLTLDAIDAEIRRLEEQLPLSRAHHDAPIEPARAQEDASPRRPPARSSPSIALGAADTIPAGG